MRVIVQVVKSSSVIIPKENINNKIAKGLNLLVGFNHEDNQEIAKAMAKKISNLRVFIDENEKMNLSVKDVNGQILSISQFTLYADAKKGNRPGFVEAMEPSKASALYNYFNQCLTDHDIEVKTGIFGADMIVNIENDGPTTIILDSDIIIKTK
ncbi:D-aminoacyl-tRNA deacylase [Mycoplasma sp. P36-A1]|uniref:D-aminoacyl-tRNA deacylase n=1 Tax=Mycoplasma sp. P36-A1 TaxID=3252900 RepID=UPI003C2F4A06